MRTAPYHAFLPFAVALALLSCSSDNSGSQPSGNDAGAQDAPADVLAESSTDTGQYIDVPDASAHESAVCTDIQSTAGTAVDADDAPLADLFVSLCVYMPDGSSACLKPVHTNSAGEFRVSVPEERRCMTRAAFQIGSPDDLRRVQLFCEVELGTGSDIVLPAPLKLPASSACSRDPLGATSQPHVITAPDGTEMTVIPDEMFLFDASYEDLRILKWNSAAWGWPCFIDPSNPPTALFAFTPNVDLSGEDAVHLSFNNDKGLAPGSTVQLYGLGGAASKRWDDTRVEEGVWAPIAEARVSDDGSTISTLPGQGLPFMTWVGY